MLEYKTLLRGIFMDEVMAAVEAVKKLIKENIIRDYTLDRPTNFDGYQDLYYQTNENVTEYLNLIELIKKMLYVWLAVVIKPFHLFIMELKI